MAFLIAAIAKDIKRWARDPASVLIWLGIPLLVGALITSMTDTDSGTPSAHVIVVDEDNSLVSRALVAVLSQTGLLSIERRSSLDAIDAVQTGDASARLRIPTGFGDAFLNLQPTTLMLETNPTERILPQLIEETVRAVVDAGFYLQLLFEDEFALLDSRLSAESHEKVDFTADDLLLLSNSLSDEIAVILPHVTTAPVTVNRLSSSDESTEASLALLFLPGVLMMAVVFSAQGLSADFWSEKELGTLQRMVSAPPSASLVLIGKLAAAGVIIALILIVALVIGFLYHQLPLIKLLSAWLWLLFSGVGLFLLFSVLMMLSPSRRAGTLISSMLLFPMLMVGGSFFPMDAMPSWLARWGQWLPNGFVVDRLTDEVVSSQGFSIAVSDWLIVVLAIGVLFLLCQSRLKRSFSRQ